MSRKLIYIIIGIGFTSGLFSPLLHEKIHKLHVSFKQAPRKPVVLKTVATSNMTLSQVSFDHLPGWNESDIKKSLLAFQSSCHIFLKQKATHPAGSRHIKLQVKDWRPACEAALNIHPVDDINAKLFFEQWFYPIEFVRPKSVRGVFTGYYMPSIKGNLTRTKQYNTPVYGLPRRIRNLSFYTREKIDSGALDNHAPVIAWIHSPVDRLFMEIEGSGVIQLPDGERLYMGYAGENGAPYTSIGSVLIKKGVLTKHNASKKSIKRYLDSRPETAKHILHQNRSFVFFQNIKKSMALGAQGTGLTPGYSLAIDKQWIPVGAPLWLSTAIPEQQHASRHIAFQRLMIAQDTGGAIKGLMRGDIYWGSGKKAAWLGEHMKNEGRYWLLLPKHTFDRLAA